MKVIIVRTVDNQMLCADDDGNPHQSWLGWCWTKQKESAAVFEFQEAKEFLAKYEFDDRRYYFQEI